MVKEIKPAYGPITEEEYAELEEISDRRRACQALIDDVIERYKELDQTSYNWWVRIKQKYNVKEEGLIIDPNTRMIRHMDRKESN